MGWGQHASSMVCVGKRIPEIRKDWLVLNEGSRVFATLSRFQRKFLKHQFLWDGGSSFVLIPLRQQIFVFPTYPSAWKKDEKRPPYLEGFPIIYAIMEAEHSYCSWDPLQCLSAKAVRCKSTNESVCRAFMSQIKSNNPTALHGTFSKCTAICMWLDTETDFLPLHKSTHTYISWSQIDGLLTWVLLHRPSSGPTTQP
jgi:hypothetical protein